MSVLLFRLYARYVLDAFKFFQDPLFFRVFLICFFVSDALVDLLAHFLQLLFIFFLDVPPLFNERPDFVREVWTS